MSAVVADPVGWPMPSPAPSPTPVGWQGLMGAANTEVSRETKGGGDSPSADVSRETSAPEAHVSRETVRPDVPVDGPLDAPVSSRQSRPPLAAQLEDELRRRRQLKNTSVASPAATRVFTVANQKGGVGKTTTAVNLSAALAQAGLRVLVIDMDPQGNASTALGIDHTAGTPGIYEVLIDGLDMAAVVQKCPSVPGLWGVPATIDLAGAEIELVPMQQRESRLRAALDTLVREATPAWDYVVIDCPPSLGLLTVNAFVAAREVLIPIQCEYYALEGLSQLLSNIELITAHLNPQLQVSTILLTMYDARTRLAAQVASEVRAHFGEQVLNAAVPRSVRISEAPSHGETIMTYDPGSTGALCYAEAAAEIARRGGPGYQDGRGR